MRRSPNPWVALPALAAGMIGGLLGWVVSDVSCRPAGCPGWAALFAVLGFLVAAGGMAVVVVLVYRSLAEHREARERGEEPAGPGCEV
ncbi:MAG: hypothetical protein R6X29_09655 [Acidimicrobiia bacterium]|jgi:hypothetical protein